MATFSIFELRHKEPFHDNIGVVTYKLVESLKRSLCRESSQKNQTNIRADILNHILVSILKIGIYVTLSEGKINISTALQPFMETKIMINIVFN